MIEIAPCKLCGTFQLFGAMKPYRLPSGETGLWCGECDLPDDAEVGELL